MANPEKYDSKRPLVTPELVDWAARKYGRAGLPQAAEADFRAYHEDQINQGKSKKYLNWTRAFQNYIRWTSPAGQYYNARQWERWLETAKQIEYGVRRRKPRPYHPSPGLKKEFDGQPLTEGGPVTCVAAAKTALAKLLED